MRMFLKDSSVYFQYTLRKYMDALAICIINNALCLYSSDPRGKSVITNVELFEG